MGRGPDLAKRVVWKRRLREFERGDEPVAAFCSREGVSVTSFYRSRQALASAAPLSGTSGELGVRKNLVGTSRFLPVEIVSWPPAAPQPEKQTSTSSACVEVLLPGGARLLVPCDAPAALRTVVAALVAGTRESIAADIRDVWSETRGNGFDVKAIRTIIKVRKMDASEREEQENTLDTYMRALGMQPDLFDDDNAAAWSRHGLTSRAAVVDSPPVHV